MFIRLTDAKSKVNMLLAVKEILTAKDYITNGTPIEGAKTVVMTRPVREADGVTHNYFVFESLDDVERSINEALEFSY